MFRYFVRRVLLAVPVLLGVATLVFSLIHLVPGDPAQAMLGDGAAPQDVAELRNSLGLDQPLLTQYVSVHSPCPHAATSACRSAPGSR